MHTELRISHGYSLDLDHLHVFCERVASLLNDVLVASEYKLSSLWAPLGDIKNRDTSMELESSIQYSSFLKVIDCMKKKEETSLFDSVLFVKDLKEVISASSPYA